jgi:hypothetical protein
VGEGDLSQTVTGEAPTTATSSTARPGVPVAFQPDAPPEPPGRRSGWRGAVDALPNKLLAVMAAAMAALLTTFLGFEVPRWLAGRTIELQPPAGLKMQLKTFLSDYVCSGGPSVAGCADLQANGPSQVGVEFQSNVSIGGYGNTTLLVVCTAADQHTGESSATSHYLRAGSSPRTTQPCWLPLPGPVPDPYTIEVAIRYPDGRGNLAEAFTTLG